MISFSVCTFTFSSAGCVTHARSNKSHSDLSEKRNALINLGINESVCRTYPVLGITHSGFLSSIDSIHTNREPAIAGAH